MDLISAYWSHRAWRRAGRRLGFLAFEAGYRFFVSPAGKSSVLSREAPIEAVHLTRGDCDGPWRYLPPEEEAAGERRAP